MKNPVSGTKEKIPPQRVTAELNGFEHSCLIRRNITDTQLHFLPHLVGVRIVLPHHVIKCSHIKNSDGEVVQWILSSMDEGEHRRIVGRIEERWNNVRKTSTPVMDDAICLFISVVSPLFGVVQPSTNNLLTRSVSPALHPRSSVVDAVDGVLQALRMRQRKIPSSLLAIDTLLTLPISLRRIAISTNTSVAQAGSI